MSWLKKISFRNSFGVFIVLLAVLVGGTLLTMKVAIDHLLYEDATDTARSWAQFLSENATDLEQIAGGEQPSAASMAFFLIAKKSDHVFRYEIFNREGYSQLVSDRNTVTLVDLSEFNAEAARAIKDNKLIVGVRQSSGDADSPSFFARAYIPVIVNQRPIAVVAAHVDQTAQRKDFFKTFLLASLSLSLLTVLSFAIPVIAWYRRTKEKQQADRRIRFLAHHDALTGLASRSSLIDALGAALAPPSSQRDNFAVYFIDLDRFKEVNDRLGHDAGDFLLKTTAARLLAVARRGDDIVARLGGDEFVVVQLHIEGEEQSKELGDRLIAALAEPVRFKEHELFTTVSIGVALAPSDGDTPERLLKSADLAVYKSKAEGGNCVRFFVPDMDAELQARIKLERIIRDAVLHDRFELHYQPLYEMSKRRLIGFEALVRLIKEDGTLIPPAVFIPIAEDMRLIDKIGEWVLREACCTAATWPEHLTVAVNLSPAQFLATKVSAIVAAALKEAKLSPQRLELEITESLLLGDSEAVMAELRALKDIGVGVVMDDFGTGYSSLSYLWKFPFDKIKIDRSFMQGFEGSSRDAETVVKTIIALGRELHMRVTVEGVETAEQVAFLDGADGDQAQGFFFGRPVPAAEVAASILQDFHRALPTPSTETFREVKVK
jgi:diguanylate cyclase (GGDEF)-like protein